MTGPSATARAFRPREGAGYKLIYLARRRPDMAEEDFPAAWRAHSRLAGTFATSLGRHFLSSRQCVRDRVPGLDPIFANEHDGSSILAMRSWPDLLAARYHPHALDELLEDEKRVFAGAVDRWTMAVEEHVLRGGAAADHVILSFLAPATPDGVSFATASEARARDLVALAPGATRIVWNGTVDPAPAFPFGAVTELWFARRDAMIEAARTPALIAALAQPGIADPRRSVHLFSRLNLARAGGGAPTD